MADRYWVGGTNTWNATATGKWSTTSGGSPGASVPTSADDVFFNAASGAVNVTVGTTVNCRNLNFTGFTGTLSGSSSSNIYGSLTIVAGMTWSYNGGITFRATSSVNLNFGGKVIANAITFNGVGGTWTLQSHLSTTSGSSISLDNGTFVANGYDVSTSGFSSGSSTARGISMGSGTWSLSGGTSAWGSISTTNLTFNAGTSTIKYTSTAIVTRLFQGNGLTYHNLWIESPRAGGVQISGSNTFNNIRIGQPPTGNCRVNMTAGTTTTVSSITLSGSLDRQVIFRSTSDGSTYNISKSSGSVVLNYIAVSDAVFTGGASWSATNSADCGGNSGITFTSNQALSPNKRGTFFT